MKTLIKLFIILLAFSLGCAACSGGGGGGSAVSGGSGTATGTFTKEVAFTTGFDYWGGEDESRIMNLYITDDIHASGWITSISVKHHLALASPATCPGMTIRMGHTASDNLVTTFADNVNNGKGSFQTVFNGTVSVPAGGADAYYSIPLSQPFYYNGVDNLVVDFTYLSSCSASTGIVAHDTSYNANVFVDGPGSSIALTGAVLTQVTDMKFHFSGGDNIAISHDKTSDAGNTSMTPGDTGHTQMLVLASDINGRGRITGMAIKPFSVTNAAVITGMTVRIAHIPASTTELSTSFNNNFQGNTPVTVTQNISYSIPVGQSSAVWIPFTSADFVYDGTSNLLIDIIATVTSGAYSVAYAVVPTSRVIDANNLTTNFGTQWDRAFEPVFHFAGGTVDVITSENSNLTFPYGTVSNTQQFLYRAAELGTKGSISRIAYRLRLDSTESTYGSFQVVLGHTTNATLGDTSFSANMTSAQTVYSGTYAIPGGLKAGDWMEIPLSTPFVYDGVSNLVVQTSNLSGIDNRISAEANATRFPDRRAYRSNSTGDAPHGCDDILADLRLWIQ